MKSSNPVLGRFSAAAQQPTYSVPGGPAGQGYSTQPSAFPSPVQAATARDVMTVDDVVVKTITLVGLVALSAAISWVVLPDSLIPVTWMGAMIVGLVLGLIISFAQVTNPIVIGTYAVVEGLFLGAVSEVFNTRWPGIVASAVIATLSVFGVMAFLYKSRIIRATPKFMKIVIGAAAGLAIVMLVNFVIYMFSGSVGPLRDGGPLAIGFSLICIVVAALMFVVSFKQIEDGVAAGLPRKYGWLGAFGILVELIWMYLEFLRLLSYFQED
ncbi:Bax inhibitor-1/YccA family protein [Allorhizocola rhizosphaerae]|uniref:Bax inhibitor-1/YccA family protein n=1 Tax=Allorhizocola rhizosphaerae TaxID=1872709 RepID=UPI000E3C0AE3|nr:Bax inhibitor-1/YccA family protein [Allorhizocola rhizosphaerae]